MLDSEVILGRSPALRLGDRAMGIGEGVRELASLQCPATHLSHKSSRLKERPAALPSRMGIQDSYWVPKPLAHDFDRLQQVGVIGDDHSSIKVVGKTINQ